MPGGEIQVMIPLMFPSVAIAGIANWAQNIFFPSWLTSASQSIHQHSIKLHPQDETYLSFLNYAFLLKFQFGVI